MNLNDKSAVFPNSHYSAKRIGALLTEVGLDYVQIESREIQSKWYHSSETETDIFIWFNTSLQIIKQQVLHLGTVVEWNQIEGVRTGIILETELSSRSPQDSSESTTAPSAVSPGKIKESTSDKIHYDQKIQQQSLKIAMDIVENCLCLEAGLKQKLLLNFYQIESLDFSFFERLKSKIMKIFKANL